MKITVVTQAYNARNYIEKCIKSWKKYLPDYEIKEWNEDNYDFTKNKY